MATAANKDLVIEETHIIGGFQYDIVFKKSAESYLVRWTKQLGGQTGFIQRVAYTPGGARLHLLFHLAGK